MKHQIKMFDLPAWRSTAFLFPLFLLLHNHIATGLEEKMKEEKERKKDGEPEKAKIKVCIRLGY